MIVRSECSVCQGGNCAAESVHQVHKHTSTIRKPAAHNQGQSSGLLLGAAAMAAGHLSQAAVAPLVALEHEVINMISTLHLAFRTLASKSKSFPSLRVSSAV